MGEVWIYSLFLFFNVISWWVINSCRTNIPAQISKPLPKIKFHYEKLPIHCIAVLKKEERIGYWESYSLNINPNNPYFFEEVLLFLRWNNMFQWEHKYGLLYQCIITQRLCSALTVEFISRNVSDFAFSSSILETHQFVYLVLWSHRYITFIRLTKSI